MICFPNAKINLGLNVVEKRPDGFHNIETIFYPISWQDALELVPSESFELDIKGLAIEGDIEDNLITKAFRAVQTDFNLPNLRLVLLKHIPMGGGLGGGSSDAAFTVKLLNDHFRLNLSIEQMEDYVRPLGSDCAFFVNNKACYAFEKGDQFESIDLDLSGYEVLSINPMIHVGTADAYRSLTPAYPKMNLKEVVQLPVEQWKDHMFNDFEKTVFKIHPEIADLKQDLYNKGAVYASMSGSGATVFGIFKKGECPSTSLFHSKYAIHVG